MFPSTALYSNASGVPAQVDSSNLWGAAAVGYGVPAAAGLIAFKMARSSAVGIGVAAALFLILRPKAAAILTGEG